MDNKDNLIEEWRIYKDNRVDRLGRHIGSIWEISNYGRVKKDGIVKTITKEYKTCKYPKIGGFYVHKAVVETFIGVIPEGYEIEHIDCNVHNNRIDNLRIVKHVDNMRNPITMKNHLEACRKEEHRSKISTSLKGKPKSDEAKERYSLIKKEYYKTHVGYWTGKEAHNKGKKLVLCDDGKRHWR